MAPDLLLLLFFFFSSPVLGVLIFAMACLLLHHLFFFFLSHSHNLPPGSMGWPYIGETLLLYSQNPNSFFASKQRRYGEVFKSHILGCPCVMIANPQGVKFVLSQAHLFKPTFPPSKQRMIGPHAIFFHDGPYHAKLRKLVLASFLPDSIRHVVPAIEQLSIATLESWVDDNQGDPLHGAKIINTFMEMKKFTFKVGILRIFGEEECLDIEDFNKAYSTLEQGYNCMPIDIPGTKFNKAMKARRHLNKSIEEVIKRRRRDGRGGGLLEKMMEDEGGQGLRLHEIVDNIIGIIFASRDTTASVLTWVIKFLKTSPDALLDSIIAEQEMIRVKKSQDQEALTWEDTRNMPLTMRVIQETLRMATILSFTFREAVEDVEYNGYFIPKGWKVLPLFRNIHHSPELFPEPQKFDPSRFEVPPKPSTFLPFGNGAHACPGNELAKLQMLIFIHHLTTKFRWELHEFKNGVQYSPFQVPQEGLPIKVERK